MECINDTTFQLEASSKHAGVWSIRTCSWGARHLYVGLCLLFARPMFQRFTSAGGNRRWEKFVLPERVVLDNFRIVAIEGPEIEDYPTLRVSDCQVLGKPCSPGSTWVSSAPRVQCLN